MYSYRGFSGETFNKGFLSEMKIDKFHPNDVVSCIADLVNDTISFKVNGILQGESGVIFNGVSGVIYFLFILHLIFINDYPIFSHFFLVL